MMHYGSAWNSLELCAGWEGEGGGGQKGDCAHVNCAVTLFQSQRHVSIKLTYVLFVSECN
jgi:hypothetical protein